MTQAVIQALEAQGHSVRPMEWLPWKRGLELTRQGKYDGTFPWGYNEERAREMVYSEPLFVNEGLAWVRADSALTYDSLLGKTYCLPLGYTEYGRTREMLKADSHSRETPADMASCFRMLAAGRVDVVVSIRDEAAQAVSEAGLDIAEFRTLDRPMHELTYHFLVAKTRPHAQEIVESLNRGLADLRASGDLDALKAEAAAAEAELAATADGSE